MAELLPLFPLTTVLFPEMLLPLHIFEPRYRLLVRRCMDEDRPFGVVLIRSGQEVGATAEPHGIGTEAKIMAFSPLSDGRSYIVVRGVAFATSRNRRATACWNALPSPWRPTASTSSR